MGVPATTGVERTNIADMEIGDYIVCEYNATSGSVGTFNNLGTSTATEIAVTGSATPSGSFYFIKTSKGLLIADRVIQHSITWDTLNAGKVIQNKPTTLGSANGIIRSLTGGVAYADANGNKSTTDLDYGAFPTNNEWDKYIVNFPSELIVDGATLDDVFHWSGVRVWTQETPVSEFGWGSATRVFRGMTSSTYFSGLDSSTSNNQIGFRPVFEYEEA